MLEIDRGIRGFPVDIDAVPAMLGESKVGIDFFLIVSSLLPDACIEFCLVAYYYDDEYVASLAGLLVWY